MTTINAAPTEVLFNTNSNGKITNDKLGVGTYASTKETTAAGAVKFNTLLDFGDGVTKTNERSTAKNADGTKTISGTSIGADGKTRSFSETISIAADGTKTVTGTRTNEKGLVTNYVEVSKKNADGTITYKRTDTNAVTGKSNVIEKKYTPNADGSMTITGTSTSPSGKVTTITGTEQRTENGFTRDLKMTNPAGKVKDTYTNIQMADGIRTEYKATTADGNTTSTLDVYVLNTTPAVAPFTTPLTTSSAA